jgi:hypothetical protein
MHAEQLVLGRSDASCATLRAAAERLGSIRLVDTDTFDIVHLMLAFYRDAVTKAPTMPDVEALSDFTGRLKVVEEAREKLVRLMGEVRAVASAASYYRVLSIGGFRMPTDVTVTLKRKDMTDPKAEAESLHERDFSFSGGARFASSAGWSITSANRQAYGQVQGHPRGSAEGDPDLSMIVPVVGLTDDAGQRNGPLALMHVRLFDIGDWVSVHASVGVTPKADDDALRAEYIVGPSIGLAENRFFATFGWYFGRTESLQEGWFVGEKVPESITSVPVRKDGSTGFAFAISVKVK